MDLIFQPSAQPSANPVFSGTMNLASGTVINWGSGDVTITHSANALLFAGAASGYSFDTSIRSIFATVATTATATLATITTGLTTPGNLVTSAYVDDGFTGGLIWSSTDDNAGVPKAGIFSKTTGGGTYIYLGTSAAYATGITNSVSISPLSEIGCQSLLLGGNKTFVSAVNNAYVYHTDALGLVIYGNGSTDDFTLAGATGANILSVATGTTTARFYGPVNIGGTFTRRSQSGVISQFQMEGTNFDTSSMSLMVNDASNATTAPSILLGRTRGATVGSNTVVQTGDRNGIILFSGADGTIPIANAIIQAIVEGTPATGDVGGRLEFLTTQAGVPGPVVRLSINNVGTATFNGKVVTVASTSSLASLNIPHGTAPTTPTNGDVWTTTAGLFIRINGVTKTVTLT